MKKIIYKIFCLEYSRPCHMPNIGDCWDRKPIEFPKGWLFVWQKTQKWTRHQLRLLDFPEKEAAWFIGMTLELETR